MKRTDDDVVNWADAPTRRQLHYNVRPRYTPGSPAQVDVDVAEHVARDEAQLFEAHREGYMGEAAKVEADRIGLQRIVYALAERRGGFDLLWDLITDEKIEGKENVSLELAALGTSRIPPKIEKNLNRWGMLEMFEKADLIDRRDLLRHSDDMDWIREHVLRLGGVRG